MAECTGKTGKRIKGCIGGRGMERGIVKPESKTGHINESGNDGMPWSGMWKLQAGDLEEQS
jgi:hypothetical protein